MSKSLKTPQGYVLFHGIAMIFVAMLVISNIIAVKIVQIGPFSIAGGIVCFPIVYIVNDVLAEVYGYERTRNVIWWGFGILAASVFVISVAVMLPAAPFYEDQEAFARLFGFVPRIALASLVAYLVGSFMNAIVLSKMKVMMEGRHLWMRTIGSTIVGEGVDSIVFNVIAFAGVFGSGQLVAIAFSGFVLKTAYEVVATPLTYLVVGWVKKVEGVDVYDADVSYSPFT
ncbi:MAG: queuosine precursor transporter [Bacteroidota bacterium]